MEIVQCNGYNPIAHGLLFTHDNTHYVKSIGGNIVISNINHPSASPRLLQFHNDKVTCIAISSQGHMLASGQCGDKSDVVIWDLKSNSTKPLFVFEEHDVEIIALCYSLDDRLLVSIGGDHKLIVWDLSSGAIVSSSNKIPKGSKCIISGGYMRDIKRRNTQNYLFASAGDDGVCLWNLNPFEGSLELIKCQNDVKRVVTDVSFSSNQESLFACTSSGDIVIYGMKLMRCQQVVSVDPPRGVSSSSTSSLTNICILNSRLVVSATDGRLLFYDHYSDNNIIQLRQIIHIHPISPYVNESIHGVCYSSDGVEVLIGTSLGNIHRCNTTTYQTMVVSEGHGCNAITGISISTKDSSKCATSCLDGYIRVWDLHDMSLICMSNCNTNKHNQSLNVHGKDKPNCLYFDSMIISGWDNPNGKIIAHSPTTGEYLWHINQGHLDGVSAICLSHNGRFIVSGGMNGEIRLWNIKTRELVCHLKEHSSRITSIVLTNNDQVAISSSRDRCLLTWDLMKEKRIFCHKQLMGGINGVIISHDETYYISIGQEKKLTFWDRLKVDATHSQYLDSNCEEEAIINEAKCISK